MLTGKQRSYLKRLANPLKPMTQVGKEGVSQAFLEQMDQLLNAHELIKVSVLENSPVDSKEAIVQVVEALNAEYVQAIGNRFTVYRESRTAPTLEIPDADLTRIKAYKQKVANAANKKDRVSKKGGRISKPLQGKRAVGRKKAAEEASEAKTMTSNRRGRRHDK